MSRLPMAMIVATVALTCVAQARAADEGSYYKIVNIATGKVLALQNETDGAGEQACLAAEAKGNHAQQWKLHKSGNFTQFVNQQNDLALDVNGESTDPGAIIIVWDAKDDSGNDNQQWSWNEGGQTSDRGVRIKSKSSGLVLDVDSDGKIIQNAAADSAKSQLWRVIAAERPSYVQLVNAGTGWLLAVESDSGFSGAQAVVSKKTEKDKPNKEHEWQLVKDGDYYKVVHRASGLVLDVSGDSQDADQPIIVYDEKSSADGNDNQRWAWDGDKPTADQPRRLKSKSSGLVLDVDDDGNIVQRAASDKPNHHQLWAIVEVKE